MLNMAKTIGNSMRDMTSMRLDRVGNLDIHDRQHELSSSGGVWWIIWLILSRDIISSGRMSGFWKHGPTLKYRANGSSVFVNIFFRSFFERPFAVTTRFVSSRVNELYNK